SRGSIGEGVTISTAGGVTVTATTPSGQQNDYIAWAVSAAGGTGQNSVAGSVAVQVLTLRHEALVGEDVTINAGGGLALSASNPMGLQTIAAAGGLSLSGNGIGAAIVVNVIDADTIARIASSAATPTVINASGAISLSATSGISALTVDVLPISVPAVT